MTKIEARIIGKIQKGTDFANIHIPGYFALVPTASEGYEHCPMLIMGQCKIYDNRPLICRLYGVVEDMPCSYGCKPEKMLTVKEAAVLIDQIRRI